LTFLSYAVYFVLDALTTLHNSPAIVGFAASAHQVVILIAIIVSFSSLVAVADYRAGGMLLAQLMPRGCGQTRHQQRGTSDELD
jgi:hypothetical protein